MNWPLFFLVEICVAVIVAFALHIKHIFCLRCFRKPEWVVRYEGDHSSQIIGLHVMYAVCRCGETAIDQRTRKSVV